MFESVAIVVQRSAEPIGEIETHVHVGTMNKDAVLFAHPKAQRARNMKRRLDGAPGTLVPHNHADFA
jgi:hypothetical protein